MTGQHTHLDVEPLHPRFAARVGGVDLRRALPDTVFAALRDAFEAWSVLVFPGQGLTPAQQVAFSERFGPLEKAITRLAGSGPGLHVAKLSNVAADGSLIPPDEREQRFNAANRLWHTDSTFKPQTALASLLHAIEVPASGGETEFASTRAAWEDLPPEKQAAVKNLWAVHDFRRSRDLVAPGLVSPEVQRMLPPVARPLVRVNPANGRASLYVASHAVSVEGLDGAAGRALLDELLDWCTQPRYRYLHRWTPGDLVMWDNRCTLHRGRPWKAGEERRVMSRTTVIDTGYDDEPEVRARAA